MLNGIRSKLIALSGLPLLAIILILSTLIWGKLNTVREMELLKPLSQLGISIGAYIHEVQIERGMSAGYIGDKEIGHSLNLLGQRQKTDEKQQALEQYLAGFDATLYGSEFQEAVSYAQNKMYEISNIRLQVETLQITAGEAIDDYSQHNARWLRLIQLSSGLTDRKSVV